jgi:M6 family metalloprotease-like protein
LSINIHLILVAALNAVDPKTDFATFDSNGDKIIDSITFLHSGYGAEFGGVDQYQTLSANRIWSHKWELGWRSNEGILVSKYHISPAVFGTSGSAIGRIGVIAHEIGHFLGLPDFYDVDGDGSGIGSWDLMANSWGFDGSQYYPPHMSGYSKVKMGWLPPTEVVYGTNYIAATELANPLYPQVIKIGDGKHGFPVGEYLLIENRQPIGFDADMPQGGLAIHHIDEYASLDTQGFPGQPGWPRNGKHYKVALLQADGAYNLEKGQNRGGSQDVFHAGYVNQLLPSSDVDAGPFPNTDAYQYGNVIRTNNQILSISASGHVMSFYFTNPNQATSKKNTRKPSAGPSTAPSAYPTPLPSTSPSAGPTPIPSATPSQDPSSTPPAPLPTKAPDDDGSGKRGPTTGVTYKDVANTLLSHLFLDGHQGNDIISETEWSEIAAMVETQFATSQRQRHLRASQTDEI